jgi:hypothetical protein
MALDAYQHELKCWPEPFEAIAARLKRVEIRLHDRDYRAGDRLLLCEWDPQTREYTGRSLTVLVLQVLESRHVPAGLLLGYVAMSIEVVDDKPVAVCRCCGFPRALRREGAR